MGPLNYKKYHLLQKLSPLLDLTSNQVGEHCERIRAEYLIEQLTISSLFGANHCALCVRSIICRRDTHARASTHYLRRALIVPEGLHQSFKIVFYSLARCGLHPAHIMTRLTHSTSLLYVFAALRLDPCFWNGRPPLFARLDGTHSSLSCHDLAACFFF